MGLPEFIIAAVVVCLCLLGTALIVVLIAGVAVYLYLPRRPQSDLPRLGERHLLHRPRRNHRRLHPQRNLLESCLLLLLVSTRFPDPPHRGGPRHILRSAGRLRGCRPGGPEYRPVWRR